MANIERLQAVMQHIMDHPEHHMQGDWIEEITPENLDWWDVEENEGVEFACGTAACFAGWAGLMYAKELGYEPIEEDRNIYRRIGTNLTEDDYYKTMGVVAPTADSDIMHVSDLAAQVILEISPEQRILFNGNNTRNALQHIVKDIVNGEDAYAHYINGDYLDQVDDNG